MSMPGGFHSPSEDDSDYTLDDEADMDLLEEDAELEEAERMAAAADLVAADDTAGEEEDEDLDEPNDREAIQLGVNGAFSCKSYRRCLLALNITPCVWRSMQPPEISTFCPPMGLECPYLQI